MAKVTSFDINRIISGEPIPIETPYPLTDRGENPQWFMSQPSDWLYDMAIAVGEAAEAELMGQPEMVTAQTLPPSKSWIAQQVSQRADTQARVSELEAKGKAITPEEDIELTNQREYLERLIDPKNYTRADEIAAKTANKARDGWLMPRLIVDEKGKLIFDLSTETGAKRWRDIGRKTRSELRGYLIQALMLVQVAKNYSADQNLS